jgi:uncharacterized protein (TIGR02145 family)
VGTRIDGPIDQTDNGVIEKYCYDDIEDSCDVYGGLYQWDEMMQYVTTNGAQGICPAGWHVPTDEEWKQLEGEVDSQYDYPDPIWNLEGYRGFDAGLNLKAKSGWHLNGNGVDDFGFSAFPGGYRYSNGDFNSIGEKADFWSSTGLISAFGRSFGDVSDESYRGQYNVESGFSVRCIKD